MLSAALALAILLAEPSDKSLATGTVMDFLSMDTYTLVEQVKGGNDSALDALHRRLEPRLLAWAAKRIPLAEQGLVEPHDVVQAALARCFRRVPTFNNEMKHGFFAYTLQAVRNELINLSKKNTPMSEEVDERNLPSGRTPLDDIISKQEQERIQVALSELPSRKQDLFIARAELQMSFPEVALHLAYPSADAARKDFERTVLKLAKLMGSPQS